MHIKDILTESLSRIAYHYTRAGTALRIIKSGEFQLSSSIGSVEQGYAPEGYNYFLSTTRTRRGGYHETIGQDAVLFVLDGNWFNDRYKSKPVDYWSDRDPIKHGMRQAEAEDRVFSKEPTIPIGGVTAIHVYIQPDADPQIKAIVRKLLIDAKTAGVKAYFYTDKDAWRNFDTRKQGDVSILKGQERTGGYVSTHKGWLLPWIELLKAKDEANLSKKAKGYLYSLKYPSDYELKNMAQGLGTDLSNARKPNSGPDREHAISIINFMAKNGLKSLPEFVKALSKKWQDIAGIKGKLTEIQKIQSSDFTGSGELDADPEKQDYKELPGGSGLLYSIDDYGFRGVEVMIWEPKKDGLPKQVGSLSLSPDYNLPKEMNALRVETITIDPRYRGKGLSIALYGIPLTILKRPLIAGDMQTPGGRKSWVNLNTVPGLDVKGYLAIDDINLITRDPSTAKDKTEKDRIITGNKVKEGVIDTIMGDLGGEYIGKNGDFHYFAFDVVPDTTNKELQAYVKQKLVNVYGTYTDIIADTGLYAVWKGK